MSKISSIALESVHRGLERAALHAQEVTSAFSTGDRDPVEPLVELSQDLRAVRASAKLIKVDQELDRSVLDILA